MLKSSINLLVEQRLRCSVDVIEVHHRVGMHWRGLFMGLLHISMLDSQLATTNPVGSVMYLLPCILPLRCELF